MNDPLLEATKAALIGELEILRNTIHELATPLNEDTFWRKPLDPGNSFGHLVLHLTGNLSHFAGARLGGTGYIRNRDLEFTQPNPPSKADALAGLNQAVEIYAHVVRGITAEQAVSPHPDSQMGTVINALVRLVAHFALHRGQMSYIARIVQAG